MDEDWKSIRQIQQGDSFVYYTGHSTRPSDQQVRERWMTRLAEPLVHTLVAESAGEVDGYVRLKQGKGKGSHTGEISTVAVHPDFQRKGIGRQLVEEILTVAAGFGLKRIRLTVHEDNDAAIRLYRRMGFEIEGREREAVKRDGKFIDLLIMGRLESQKA